MSARKPKTTAKLKRKQRKWLKGTRVAPSPLSYARRRLDDHAEDVRELASIREVWE
jgi:hypothetical protein